MAKNDKSKSTKTSHVMNLVRRGREPAPAEEAAAPAPAPDAPAAPVPTPPVPPIISSIGADAAASAQIKDALEDALARELEPPAPPELPVQAAPELEPEPAPVPAPAPQPEPQPEPEPVPVSAPPASVPLTSAHPDEEATEYINVMQYLVDEKAEKYVQMFGLCSCSRCLADVKALALNHLPPKYVVMGEGDRIPKLTFYEGRFSSDITAQLINACKQVMTRPHHTR